MIDNMDHQCSEYIIKNLINVSLKELNDYSIIIAFDLIPWEYLIRFCLLIILFFIYLKVKKQERQNHYMKNLLFLFSILIVIILDHSCAQYKIESTIL